MISYEWRATKRNRRFILGITVRVICTFRYRPANLRGITNLDYRPTAVRFAVTTNVADVIILRPVHDFGTRNFVGLRTNH